MASDPERYSIERAQFFTEGNEEEQADEPEMEEAATQAQPQNMGLQSIQQAVKAGAMSPAAALAAYAAIKNGGKASP